jgi:diguanylate cyclase (GGDEF)-like protein
LFNNGKKTIGVFVQQVNEEYQNLLCKGISKRANELDYNVAVFTNFGGYGQEVYDKGEINIVNLPYYEKLDGIILAPDTMNLKNLEAMYKERISSRCHCPVVSVRKEREGYYNVLIENDSVMDDIITHFIEVHKFTRINFLSGPRDHREVNKRLQSYRRILAEHGIPVEEERIYYGDLWKREADNAVEQWLNGPLEWPQAIICANDVMAITVCKALAARGIKVPEQIAVSGCDDIEDAEEFYPAISTVRLPVVEMGFMAVDKIHNHHLGLEQQNTSYISSSSTILRASCGCNMQCYNDISERKLIKIANSDSLQNELIRIAEMSTDLTGLATLEEVLDRIEGHWFEYESVSHFYLCMRENWYYTDEEAEGKIAGNPDAMIMQRGLKSKINYSRIRFSSPDLLPKEAAVQKATTYYFALLHYQHHNFGYVVFSFGKTMTRMETLQAWLNIVSSVIENVRMHMEVKRLVYQLEDMSIRDDLTGLYNRRVMDTLGKKLLEDCIRDHTKLMVFVADMDRLKHINDNLGHTLGDKALKVVADALNCAADDDEICIRLGGDEFMVIGMDYDEDKLNRFTNRFVEELNRFNGSDESEFDVYVSYGWNLIQPDANTKLEECLFTADYRMYQQKYNKVSNNIKANL